MRALAASIVAPPAVESDPDLIARFLSDAAHYPGGHLTGVVRPRSTEEASAALAGGGPWLAVGAQSSLTGGATPMGATVLSTERLTSLVIDGPDRVRAGAGVTLQALQDALAARGLWLPPVPTWLGATVGGAVATNAAGAATFKYGAMREWVEGLRVVLASGETLTLARGAARATGAGVIEIDTARGLIAVPVPPYAMPDVPKRSAGYFAAPGMDLVDLFIGSEGTLGVITEATLRVAPRPAGVCWALVPMRDEPAAIALVADLRRASRATWATGEAAGIDVSAIEHLDHRSLEILREDGADRRHDVRLPPDAGVVLLVQIEVSAAAAARDLWSDLARATEVDAEDAPLVRLCRLLQAHGVLEDTEVALPGDLRRARAFVELREAVPAGVNARVAAAQASIDPRITKTAADMIVPFDRFGALMTACRALCAARDLDLVVWGHISDGNVHPNVIPRRVEDVAHGREAILELGRLVIAMGGCPLAEHGVGRNPVKQQLLELLYGRAGIDAMRAVRRALDPGDRLAPGVLFDGHG
ncbi:MAG: FAD-binding oxidoreductase [Vicinamibacterales bacterium]|nr:FAD-binding oxidoreductase [Vicinamibacterales bacterium]